MCVCETKNDIFYIVPDDKGIYSTVKMGSNRQKCIDVKRHSRVLLCLLILLMCVCIYCSLESTAFNSNKTGYALKRNCTVLSDVQHSQKNVRISHMTPDNISQYVRRLRSDILLHRSLDPYFIPRETMVNPHNYSFLITAEKLCEKESPHLLIVVTSVYDHVEVRQIIRESWGSVVRTGVWVDGSVLPNIKLIFLIGIRDNLDVFGKLQQENVKYGDIVLANFIDSYRNLTIKTMSAFQWTIRYCAKVNYLLKIDEDVVVVLPRLVKILKTIPLTHLVGRQGFQTNVVRGGSIPKWIVDKKEYEPDFYPPYILGNFYVIPNSAIPVLFKTAQYLPILTMEDVFITGVVRLVTGLQIHDVGKKNACLYECDFDNPNSVVFTVGTSQIRSTWLTLGKQLSGTNRTIRYAP